MAMLFGAVADDDTGASDLAGMLADQGVRCILAIDLPSSGQLADWAKDCDAVVLGVGSRAIDPSVAYQRMRAGARLLNALDPPMIQVKYCSTFDSTAEGNIGPAIDAALDELGQTFTIALPALPVNGRTTYMGYHFVNDKLLSDSSMRHHPLTPMTNPNLVTHLASQTRRTVGLAPYPRVRAGVESLKNCFRELEDDGVNIAIVDSLSDADLTTVCEATRGLRLISGSSAPAMKLPLFWKREDGWRPVERGSLLPRGTKSGCGFLVVSGSCSPATGRQNEVLARSGASVIDVSGLDLVRGDADFPGTISAAAVELASGRTCLLRTSKGQDDIDRVHQWARQAGLTESEAGCRIAYGLADLVQQIVRSSPPEALIIAGGETSGAICRALHFGALRVGPNIEPGVPLCVSVGGVSLPVVLKSGNFGGPNFYDQAITAAKGLR
jgi:uncharacterized protein YgbK (DUF1537 family)